MKSQFFSMKKTFLCLRILEELVNDEIFEKSETERETYKSIEGKQYPQEYDFQSAEWNFLDDSTGNEKDDQRVLAIFKHSIRNKTSIFLISQDFYELPKKTIRANGNKYHIFKPNN